MHSEITNTVLLSKFAASVQLFNCKCIQLKKSQSKSDFNICQPPPSGFHSTATCLRQPTIWQNRNFVGVKSSDQASTGSNLCPLVLLFHVDQSNQVKQTSTNLLPECQCTGISFPGYRFYLQIPFYQIIGVSWSMFSKSVGTW